METTENIVNRLGNRIYVLIGTAAIIIVFCLGLLNSWKDLMDSQTLWLKAGAVYVQQMLEWQESVYEEGFESAESVLQLIETDQDYDSIIGTETQYIYVYDKQNDELVGTGDVSRIERAVESDVQQSNSLFGYQYETAHPGDRYTIVVEKDTSEIKEAFMLGLPFQFMMLAASLVLFYILCYILERAKLSDLSKVRFMSGALFAAILLVTISGSFSAWNNHVKNWTKTQNAIYADLDANIDFICSLSDEDLAALSITDENIEEARNELANTAVAYYSPVADKITVNRETFLDTDLPIRSRIHVDTDSINIINIFLTYVLEALMYAILEVFVFRMIFYYRSNSRIKKTLDQDKAEVRTSMDRMKLINTIKSFSDAITVTVTAKLLMTYLQNDHGSSASQLMTITIFTGTALAIAGVLMIPVMLRAVKRLTHIMVIMLTACFFGNLCCFLAGESMVYIIGYLLIIVGDAVFGILFLLVPKEMMDAGDAYSKEVGNSATGRNSGQIVGYVVSGTLVSLIPFRYMFLIATLLLGWALYPAIKLTMTRNRQQFPYTAHSFAVLKKKKFLLFLLLVQIPFAMVNYYFKYVVPLRVDAMQLAAIFVSFVFFFRMVMKLLFKMESHVQAFWKKFLPETGVMIILVSISILFVLLKFLPGVAWLMILTLLIGFFEARLNGMITSTGFEDLDNNNDYFFGYQGSSTISQNVGKSVAAGLTSGIGILALPGVISASALIYWLIIRFSKKKEQQNPQG